MFRLSGAVCDSKIVPKAACDSENCSESRPRMYTGEIQPMRVTESRNRNLMRLTEQSLELVSVFKEPSRNFTFNFLFIKPCYKFKNLWRMAESTDLI